MQSITLPQKPKYTKVDEKTGKIVIDGCYPGYGTTLGNAIRRVMLSSLSGAAITSVKIKGVKHEFSTIPNVLEDVIQIILNMKQVRLRVFKNEAVTISLKVKGEKVVTAGMIECPSDVEIVNKDAHIATITSAKGEIEMEMEVGTGIGYVPVEQQEREKKEVGVIALDAIYTPIRRVNYTIENMRVGKRTDFERITLDVTTDGSIDPQEAFMKAINILVGQFSELIAFETAKEAKDAENEEAKVQAAKALPVKEKEAEEVAGEKAVVEVKDLKGLSTRTLNVLEKGKIESLDDILKLTEDQLSGLEGMGAKGIKEIKKAIGDFGVNLKKTE